MCDTPSGAVPTLEILEYANIQLLELKHYDEVLTKLLSEVYSSLERANWLSDPLAPGEGRREARNDAPGCPGLDGAHRQLEEVPE